MIHELTGEQKDGKCVHFVCTNKCCSLQAAVTDVQYFFFPELSEILQTVLKYSVKFSPLILHLVPFMMVKDNLRAINKTTVWIK